MKQLLIEVKNLLEKNQNLILVTVVSSSGSTPRASGAQMIVNKNGRVFGTVGGGAVEYNSEIMAKELLQKKESAIKDFILSPNESADIGMVCGGSVVIYFQFISAENPMAIKVINEALTYLEKMDSYWIITEIYKNGNWNMAVYSKKDLDNIFNIPNDALDMLLTLKPISAELNDKLYFSQPLTQAGTVYIFGGGHISQELVPMLTHVGFRCAVYEDRQEFATTELFPDAYKIHLGAYNAFAEQIKIHKNDYIVIMTRGHLGDFDVEFQALKTDAGYIGVIGSSKKTIFINDKLLKAGYTNDDLARVSTPIGIEIKAETPTEIAISITAELILKRATLG